VYSARVAALAFLALIPAARAGQYSDFQPLAASEYPSYQEQQGIGLAVVPIFDTSSQKKYLGVNLLAQGFLPVYVIIENHASPQSAFLLRDQMLYAHDDFAPVSRGQEQARPSPSGVVDTIAEGSALWGGVLGFVGIEVALHLVSNVSDVRMNLLKKELRSQTIAPGKAGNGFVFVPTGKGGKPAKELSLDVPVKAGASGEDIHFYSRIDMAGSKK
jgi:hypothetical protein